MGILWMIIIGFVVGAVARLLKPGNDGMGILLTSLLGIAGSFLAGFLGRVFKIYNPNEPIGFIASVIGAVLLLYLVQMAGGRRRV